MADFQPLTPEQFQKARSAGFSAQQITANEQKRKASSMPATPAAKPKSFLDHAADFGAGVVNTINTIGKPLTSLAALPLQLGVKGYNAATGSNVPDPFAEGIGANTGPLKAAPVSTFQDKSGGQFAAEEAGNALQAASLFFPAGRVASGISTGLKPLVGQALGRIAGNVASGAAGGYGFDVGANLSEGKGADSFSPGLGTGLGVALPLVPPAIRTVARGVGESLGVSTGVGYGAVKEGLAAATAGGERAKAYTDALRGRTAPEDIVGQARDSLGQIVQSRTQDYQAQLAKIAGDKTSHDITPILDSLKENLAKFKIGRPNAEGTLDFSQSAIRFDKKAQSEIQTVYDEMKKFGTKEGDRTAVGLDSLKRAFGDLYSESSNVRAFTANMTKSVRDVLGKVPGYDKLAKDYADKTGLIKDVQKGLSLGNKAGTDAAFKKLSGALRTNNEFRKELVDELDKASGGFLSSQIAGQQLSEPLPRGLARQIEGFGAVGLFATGLGHLLALLPLASPRIVGELANVLGISRRNFGRLAEIISAKGAQFPGDALVSNIKGPKPIPLGKGAASVGALAGGAGLTGGALLGSTPQNLSATNDQQVQQERSIPIPGRDVSVTPDDLQELRNVLFAEISNRASEKQGLEARTIINTALNRIEQYRANGKELSLGDVLRAPNQYQGYNSKEYKRIKNGLVTATDSQKIQAIDQAIQELLSGEVKDNTQGSVFYQHKPDSSITYKSGSLFK